MLVRISVEGAAAKARSPAHSALAANPARNELQPTTSSSKGWNFSGVRVLAPEDPNELEAERLVTASGLFSEPLAASGIGASRNACRSEGRFTSASGAPMDGAARSFFEGNWGWDFSSVRVHADDASARAADALGAVAFTVGNDIAFGRGRYHPESATGRALLAHELVHVMQATKSRGAPPVLARQTVEQYRTRGVSIKQEQMNEAAKFGYWESKIQQHGFIPKMDPTTSARLSFAEESNAVLSVVWQMRPQAPMLAVEMTKLIHIPQRRELGSRSLTYKITFRPPAQAKASGTVDVIFVAEGKSSTPITAEEPSTSFTPKTKGGYGHGQFPGNDVERYWEAHRGEERQVFNWIENAASNHFEQIITAKPRKASGSQPASFHVKGEKSASGTISNLVIIFLGSVAAERWEVTPDYLSHDFADADIEKAQIELHSRKKDRLGKINGLEKAPFEERGSVKFAVQQYFEHDTRSAEVDAIVPLVDPPRGAANRFNSNRRVLYTFRFKAQTNDVDVERIGELGREINLAPLGSLRQVNGFAGHAVGASEQDKVASLTRWLKLRYPGVSPSSSSTVAELERDITAKIRAGSGEPAWFKENYGIVILDKNEAATWLAKKIFGESKRELQDLKSFTPEELRTVELALERMSDSIVETFKGARMIRQKANIKWIEGTKPPRFEVAETAGDTIQGETTTIRIFDNAKLNADELFLGGMGPGGQPAVTAVPTGVVAHEFGHIVAHQPGIQKTFDRLVKAKSIKPITWYAEEDPPKELFSEAFAIFYLDPEWLNKNWPDLFNFFAALDRSGPTAKAPNKKIK